MPKLSKGSLTQRELEIFGLVGQAMTTKEIAQELSISVKTIESHREHIKNKLGIEGHLKLLHAAFLHALGIKESAYSHRLTK